MSYTAHNFATGDTIEAADFNEMDSKIDDLDTVVNAEWSLLGTVDCSTNDGTITFSNLSDYTEFMINAELVRNETSTASGYKLSINGEDIASGVITTNAAVDRNQWCHAKYDGLFWHVKSMPTAITNSMVGLGTPQSPYSFIQGVGKATTFTLTYLNATYKATSGTITIWGK